MSGTGSRLTARGAATRARIVEGAAETIREHGAAMTLDDVLARTRTSKSQLFHYFPGGKEELLLAVAEHEAARVLTDQEPYLDELSDWSSWEAWREAVLARYRAQGQSCPLSVILTEISRVTPASRAVSAQLIEEWERRLAAGVERLRIAGLVSADVDAGSHAKALLAGIQGGVVVMLATGSISYLEAVLDGAIERLRSSAGSASPAYRR